MDLEALTRFINDCCVRYSIDESHGLLHALNTMNWAEKLLAAEDNVSPDERRMALYGAALHDMCDAKYTDIQEAGDVICAWLTRERGWTATDAAALIRIIQSTSYSKLKLVLQVDPRGEGAPYPDHGRWQRAFHIIRHADLLEGYSVRRCMLYTRHRLPQVSEDDYWPIVNEVFQQRVLRYVSDGWLYLPQAVVYAAELDRIARQDLAEKKY